MSENSSNSRSFIKHAAPAMCNILFLSSTRLVTISSQKLDPLRTMSTVRNMFAVVRKFHSKAEHLLKLDRQFRVSTPRHLEVEAKPSTAVPRWHLFLNQLCFLCDRRSGGAAVTAATVARINSLPIFLVAANSGVTRKSFDCIKTVLGTLRNLIKGRIESTWAQEEILKVSTTACCRKIRNHYNRLRREVDLIESQVVDRDGKLARLRWHRW